MHAYLSGCTLEVDVTLYWSPHASLACVCTSSSEYFLQCLFGNHPRCADISNSSHDQVFVVSRYVAGSLSVSKALCLRLVLIPRGAAFGSALPESEGLLALLHALEGNIDDGNQALGGAQRAEQPVWVRLPQDPQDVALVEAQLAGLGGYVVAQRSYFTEERQRTRRRGEQSGIKSLI